MIESTPAGQAGADGPNRSVRLPRARTYPWLRALQSYAMQVGRGAWDATRRVSFPIVVDARARSR